MPTAKALMQKTDVGATAKIVAAYRSASRIPYSKRIATLSGASKACSRLITAQSPETNHLLRAFFELRFKALSQVIIGLRLRNVLEIAAGFSPRGLILARGDSSLNYLATDWDNASELMEIYAKILENEKSRPNLSVCPLNALDGAAMHNAADRFTGPVIIAHEGFLRYQNRAKKGVFAKNVRSVLEKKGGFWVTPDVLTKDEHRRTAPLMDQRSTKEINSIGGRNLHRTYFEDADDAEQFFKKNGFIASRVRQMEIVDHLRSPITSRALDYLKNREIWIMRLA